MSPRRPLRAGTALLLGCLAPLVPLVTDALAAGAAPNPGQSIWNDYGQTPAQVAAEVSAQVAATPAVVQAREAVASAHATLLARVKAEKAAKAAYRKAVRSKKKARIAAAKRAYKAAQKRTAAARRAEAAARATLASTIESTTAAVRARHYTPVDGTYLGSTAQYFIPNLGLEPVQVQVTVSGGHVSAVSAPVYVKVGDSGSYNSLAIPTLIDEAVAADDTAVVASVSGATLTSEAFTRSLQSALGQAGFPV